MSFQVTGIHHTTLVVSDLEDARVFYGGILGLPTIDRPDYDFDACQTQLGQNGVRLVGGPGKRPHSGRAFAFCKDPAGNLVEITGPPT